MKKLLFIAGAVVAMVACNKTESSISVSNPEEIGFMTMTQNETRGYVTGNYFFDRTNPDCFGKFNSTVSRDSTYRDMIVSAYNKTDKEDYFLKETFSPADNIESDKTFKTIWHASPVLYWPIGKDLQFLSYSSRNVLGRSDIVANWDGAKKVSFNVTELQCYQNDIVYAQASGNNRGTQYTGRTANGSNSKNGLAIKFFHAQAWLTFNITFDGADAKVNTGLEINSIVLKNVYNTGVLTFEYDESTEGSTNCPKPKASWNFFTQCKSDVLVDDCWSVLKSSYLLATENKNGVQLNMLMPEQKHENFVLNYTLNGYANSIEIPIDKDNDNVVWTEDTGTNTDTEGPGQSTKPNALALENGKWVMGAHYIYNIKFNINEITFAPTVTVWTEVTGFDDNPQAL